MKYPVVVHKSEYGYDVHCPILKGCHSQGDTVDEALENILRSRGKCINAVHIPFFLVAYLAVIFLLN